MGVAPEGSGDDLLQLGFDLIDTLPGREASAVADPKDVGVDGKGFLAERGVEDDVGGLAADAGQSLQLIPGARDLAAVSIDQRPAQRDHVLRLGVEQADGLDRVSQAFLAELNHLPGRLDAREQRPARDVDAGVGSLRGQDHRDQQLIRIAGFELGRRRRVRLCQPAEEFEHLVAGHDAPITSRIE